jgi:D-proline reductase (dithiol) PrdB
MWRGSILEVHRKIRSQFPTLRRWSGKAQKRSDLKEGAHMARLDKIPEPMRSHLTKTKLPKFESRPWVAGPPLKHRRVAIVSTAGLHRRGDRPFTFEPGDIYRVIAGDIAANDLIMSHVSTNFDRSGFQQDWNLVFPLDRLRELCDEGQIQSVAQLHYSFMGAVDPQDMEAAARKIAGFLLQDQVNAVLLTPV